MTLIDQTDRKQAIAATAFARAERASDFSADFGGAEVRDYIALMKATRHVSGGLHCFGRSHGCTGKPASPRKPDCHPLHRHRRRSVRSAQHVV